MRLVRIQLCVSARSRFVCVLHESTRARTSSTRATHVDARTKSFGPRIRDTDMFIARPCLSFNSSRRSLRRAPARLVSRREEKRDRRRDREHSVPKPQSTPDAPNERTRGTPRGVPTISTCIRVTPTTSRVRFRSARISATASCVRLDPAWRSGPAERAVRSTGRAEHARRARAGLHPRVFRHDSVWLTRYALRLYHSRSGAAGVVERRLAPSPSHPGALKSKRKHAYRLVATDFGDAAPTKIRQCGRPCRRGTQNPRARRLGGAYERWEQTRC